MTPEEEQAWKRAILRDKIDHIQRTINAVNEGDLFSIEIDYHLLEEALSLLLRHEQRRLACTPDIVIILDGGAVQDCLSEEESMTYTMINEDDGTYDNGIIVARQVIDIEQEVKVRIASFDDEEEETE